MGFPDQNGININSLRHNVCFAAKMITCLLDASFILREIDTSKGDNSVQIIFCHASEKESTLKGTNKIWVCTVCLGLSVLVFTISTVC